MRLQFELSHKALPHHHLLAELSLCGVPQNFPHTLSYTTCDQLSPCISSILIIAAFHLCIKAEYKAEEMSAEWRKDSIIFLQLNLTALNSS